MEYRNFSVEDFVADPYFQRWVYAHDEGTAVFWKNWLHEHPEQKENILKAAAILRNMQFKEHEVPQNDAEQLWQEIVLNRSAGRYKVKKQSRFAYPWYAAAASIALFIAVSVGLFKVLKSDQALLGISYQTDFGQTQSIVLPDGSSVVLGANSTLHYASGWLGEGERKVSLDGEAYFSVVHTEDDEKFVVLSDEVEITVLGTKFNVNNRRGENQIMLEEGSIRLSVPQVVNKLEKVEVEMQPGELLTVEDGKITKANTQADKYISWTAGVLVFEKAPLSHVIQMIEDHFGYTVITQDIDAEEMIMTAELRTSDLDMMLLYISEIFYLQIEKTDDTITLKKP